MSYHDGPTAVAHPPLSTEPTALLPSSSSHRQQPSAHMVSQMSSPPSSSSSHRTALNANAVMSGQATYPSIAGAGVVLQQQQLGATSPTTPRAQPHPPSKSATGGQSHSHRPVSAMPTPASHSSASRAAALDAEALTSGNGAYADRRASAHPTVPVASHSVSGLPQMAMSPSIDPAFASSAINSGIPITSPAALSYFAAHPRRQQVHFGNYLLLQTLGEGEFGKVKLGVHKEWGEEVAVKLIKRDKVGAEHGQLQLDAATKDPAKMTKVEREIQVLKDVRHPNIVRLYEVIESDRFIGIVLEYASGGELFDHILAHKYLKERDACRLFAQLISGVNYLHEKKIVHRDLKLENLLLDRNRNVIITDFGFANDFGERRDDLMATSCGSPCYAAPELVVQEGLYAGSAVDVWSCGVILYAMLAGYLPFDDDPANPEGDNINLLYKYIIATPLSFPDYISAEPRDLLSRMLVPDPDRRIDLAGVMAHSWLAPYRELFKFTVDELERAAVEQQTKKRQIYRQQMILQQQMQEKQQQQQQQQQRQGGTADARSKGAGVAIPSNSTSSAKTSRTQQRATAMPELSSFPLPKASVPPSASQPLQEATNRTQPPDTERHDVKATVAGVERSSSPKVASPPAPSDKAHRTPAGAKPQRHTIQLEYQDQSSGQKKQRTADVAPQHSPSRRKVAKKISAPRMAASGSDLGKAPSEAEEATLGAQSPPAVPAIPTLPALASTASVGRDRPISRQDGSEAGTAVGKGRPSAHNTSGERQDSQSAGGRGTSNPLPQPSSEVPFPLPAERAFSSGAGRPSTANVHSSSVPPSANRGPERSASRHRKGMSTDKSFLSRLLSTSPNGTSSPSNNALGQENLPSSNESSVVQTGQSDVQPRTDAVNKRGTEKERDETGSGNRAGSARRKAMSLVVGRANSRDPNVAVQDREKAKEAGKASVKEERRLTGRLRLSSTASQSTRPGTAQQQQTSSGEGGRAAGTPGSNSIFRANTQTTPASASSRHVQAQQRPSDTPSSRQTRSSARVQNDIYAGRGNDSSSTVGPSSGAAKKVMDWFRKKSLAKGTFNEQPPLPPLELPARGPVTRSQAAAAATVASAVSTPTESSQQNAQTRVGSSETPKVVVTGGDDNNGTERPVSDGGPSSRSTSGAYSHVSSILTDHTGLTSATEGSNIFTPAHQENLAAAATAAPSKSRVAKGGAETPVSDWQSQSQSQPTPRASSNPINGQYNENAMRFHLGAVDQSALTSRSPPAVFAEVSRALYQMGIEARKEREEEFKLECVRRKRANQSLIGATQGLGLSIRTSVFPPTQADYERSALRTPGGGSNLPSSASVSSASGAMSPSPSGIRNFLRRGSQLSPSMGNVALPEGTDPQQPPPPTIYGEPRVDGGQEVRFSVEITRIKNLPGLYSVDIRRLRGPLTSYKFLYHNVLLATNLSGRD